MAQGQDHPNHNIDLSSDFLPVPAVHLPVTSSPSSNKTSSRNRDPQSFHAAGLIPAVAASASSNVPAFPEYNASTMEGTFLPLQGGLADSSSSAASMQGPTLPAAAVAAVPAPTILSSTPSYRSFFFRQHPSVLETVPEATAQELAAALSSGMSSNNSSAQNGGSSAYVRHSEDAHSLHAAAAAEVAQRRASERRLSNDSSGAVSNLGGARGLLQEASPFAMQQQQQQKPPGNASSMHSPSKPPVPRSAAPPQMISPFLQQQQQQLRAEVPQSQPQLQTPFGNDLPPFSDDSDSAEEERRRRMVAAAAVEEDTYSRELSTVPYSSSRYTASIASHPALRSLPGVSSASTIAGTVSDNAPAGSAGLESAELSAHAIPPASYSSGALFHCSSISTGSAPAAAADIGSGGGDTGGGNGERGMGAVQGSSSSGNARQIATPLEPFVERLGERSISLVGPWLAASAAAGALSPVSSMQDVPGLASGPSNMRPATSNGAPAGGSGEVVKEGGGVTAPLVQQWAMAATLGVSTSTVASNRLATSPFANAGAANAGTNGAPNMSPFQATAGAAAAAAGLGNNPGTGKVQLPKQLRSCDVSSTSPSASSSATHSAGSAGRGSGLLPCSTQPLTAVQSGDTAYNHIALMQQHIEAEEAATAAAVAAFTVSRSSSTESSTRSSSVGSVGDRGGTGKCSMGSGVGGNPVVYYERTSNESLDAARAEEEAAQLSQIAAAIAAFTEHQKQQQEQQQRQQAQKQLEVQLHQRSQQQHQQQQQESALRSGNVTFYPAEAVAGHSANPVPAAHMQAAAPTSAKAAGAVAPQYLVQAPAAAAGFAGLQHHQQQQQVQQHPQQQFQLPAATAAAAGVQGAGWGAGVAPATIPAAQFPAAAVTNAPVLTSPTSTPAPAAAAMAVGAGQYMGGSGIAPPPLGTAAGLTGVYMPSVPPAAAVLAAGGVPAGIPGAAATYIAAPTAGGVVDTPQPAFVQLPGEATALGAVPAPATAAVVELDVTPTAAAAASAVTPQWLQQQHSALAPAAMVPAYPSAAPTTIWLQQQYPGATAAAAAAPALASHSAPMAAGAVAASYGAYHAQSSLPALPRAPPSPSDYMAAPVAAEVPSATIPSSISTLAPAAAAATPQHPSAIASFHMQVAAAAAVECICCYPACVPEAQASDVHVYVKGMDQMGVVAAAAGAPGGVSFRLLALQGAAVVADVTGTVNPSRYSLVK